MVLFFEVPVDEKYHLTVGYRLTMNCYEARAGLRVNGLHGYTVNYPIRAMGDKARAWSVLIRTIPFENLTGRGRFFHEYSR